MQSGMASLVKTQQTAFNKDNCNTKYIDTGPCPLSGHSAMQIYTFINLNRKHKQFTLHIAYAIKSYHSLSSLYFALKLISGNCAGPYWALEPGKLKNNNILYQLLPMRNCNNRP